MPSWRRGGGAGDQVPIQALIENAEEPDARRRDRRLIGGVGPRLSRRTEVLDVDAAWKLVDVRMQIALGEIQAVAASEDDIRALEERALGIAKARRRARESAEFVHAVVHRGRRREVRAVAQRHRRVVPRDEARYSVRCQKDIDERLDLVHPAVSRHVRGADDDSRGVAPCFDGGLSDIGAWFLDIENAARARSARQEVLRPLEHEVPSQMRETDEVELTDVIPARRVPLCVSHVVFLTNKRARRGEGGAPRKCPRHSIRSDSLLVQGSA